MVVGSSSSSSSSVTSLTSFGGSSDEAVPVKGASGAVVKFLCSYGGKILPRHPDGKLRYVGGDTRVLAVDRAAPFSELAAKLAELCGWGVAVSLRCQLPTEDLDALVSITSDEDFANLLEEYDLASRDRDSPLKIRAFLSPLHQPPAPVKARPTTPPSSAGKGKSPLVPSLAPDVCARHQPYGHQHQQVPLLGASCSRLPVRPPAAAVCYGQHHHYRRDHQHRGCILHGGASGGGGATYYRLAMLS
uniref:Translation initiation factor IF-2 n=1 Tax=Anthurium amnicola TaxID=1678845 RepID=A0A1D1Y615_9ARAE